jgi:hypothetical protein
VFAYFKNLALLLCFVGFGLGCALARQKTRWSLSVKALESLSQGLGAAADLELWTTGAAWTWLNYLAVVLLTAILFLLLVWIFVPTAPS